MICYEFFSLRIFVHIKLSYYLFKRQDLLEKIIERYHNGGDKKEAAAYYIAKKEFWKKKQEISIETCQKKQKRI